MNHDVYRRSPCALVALVRLALVLGALCVGLDACAGASTRPFSAPAISRSPEEVLETLHAREARIHSLKGLFEADLSGAYLPFSRRIYGTLFYQRPHTIRVTGLTRAGGTVFDCLLRGPWYALRVPEHPDIVVGRVADLGRSGDVSIPIQLSLRAVELLLGKTPWASRSPEIRVEGEAYRYIAPVAFPPPAFLEGRHDSAGGHQHVWVDRYSAHIHTVEFRTSEEETRLTLSASDFRPVDDGQHGRDDSSAHRNGSDPQASALVLPFVINATDATTSGSVELSFLELSANVSLPEQAFRVR